MKPISRWWVAVTIAITGLALVWSGLNFAQVFQSEWAIAFASWGFSILAMASGIIVAAAAWRFCTGRERFAWMVIGVGIALWACGEVTWSWYETVLDTETPYPGVADVFYVAGYPMMFIGIAALPYLKAFRFERLRLTLDTLAGSVAVLVLAWIGFLQDLVFWDSSDGLLLNVVNNGYPVGDVLLVLALLFVAIKRTEYRFDPRILLVAVGMALTAAADVIFALQFEEYVQGGWLDGLFMLGYALFAAAAVSFVLPRQRRDYVIRKTTWTQLAAPYVAIVAMFFLAGRSFFSEASLADSTLEVAAVVVAALIILRQWAAILENRELVEKERWDLVASISHELRTPLTAVAGFTQMLREEWDSLDTGTRKEMIGIVDDQSRHLSRIVTDLVELARGRLATAQLDRSVVDFRELVRDATDMIPALTENGTQVETVIETGLVVDVEPARIIQVLVNLLSNALTYGNGRISIQARHEGRQTIIEIHDNGPGVPRKYEEQIWERFERGAHRFDASKPGSGIGLTIVRSLCEAHGGHVEYRRSNVLGGACFAIQLPAARVPAMA